MSALNPQWEGIRPSKKFQVQERDILSSVHLAVDCSGIDLDQIWRLISGYRITRCPNIREQGFLPGIWQVCFFYATECPNE